MRESMIQYYAERASEYEAIYEIPERQENLGQLRKLLRCDIAQMDLLEVACGTGYWTAHMAAVANSITACDINPEVLELARAKKFPRRNVSFQIADAYELPDFPLRFEAGVATFWWSHIAKERLGSFLEQFHSKLEKGARVVFMDNTYLEGSSTPLSRTDAQGNTFQFRTLKNGNSFEVLKNFPTREEIRTIIAPFAEDMVLTKLRHYWYLAYTLES
jgi:SAM-dependent methyltransferase